MLNLFRRGGAVGQIVIGAIAFTIILVFALEFRPGRRAGPSKLSQECSVEVGGRCVPIKEFWAAYGLALPPLADKDQIRRFRIVSHVLDGLVERELLLQDADRLGISASEEAVDHQLLEGLARLSLPVGDAPWFAAMLGLCPPAPDERSCVMGTEGTRLLPVKSRKSKKFDLKIYERVIRHTTNRSPKEFKDMQVRETLAARMRELIQTRVQVSEGEAFLQYQQARSTATVQVVQVKADWFARFVVDASDAAVDAWALAHTQQVEDALNKMKSDFKAGCQLVSLVKESFDATTSDDDKVLLRDKVEQAAQAAAKGTPFERIVRQFSDGPVANVQASPHCLPDSTPDELKQSVVSLKPGEVSSILESNQGFFVAKSHGVLQEASIETAARRAVARSLLVAEHSRELASKFAKELVDKVRAGTDIKQAVAEMDKASLGLTPDNPLGLQDPGCPEAASIGPFNIQGSPIPNVAPGQAPAAKAFAMEKGAVESLQTAEGFAVMQLEDKSLVTREQFSLDKVDFLRQLRRLKAHEALVRYVARLRKKAEKEITLNSELARMDDEEASPKKP